MIEFLNNIDQEAFLFLNGMHNDLFDFLMHWITYQQTWYPFYAIVILWMFWKFKWNALVPLLIIILAITFSDQFTSSFMKPFFARLRPCYEPSLADLVHVVDGCGGQYGFASSHASNSFALATLLYLFFKNYVRYTWILFIWAGLVSYSRVYVGVHYPGDILTGALIGYFTGLALFYLYQKLPPKYMLRP